MRPEPGWTTEAELSRIIDGDTIEVEIKRKVKVRLKDLLVDELKTPDGESAKQYLIRMLKVFDKLTLFIPANSAERLMDFNSFDRVVGTIWLKNGDNLADKIVESGHGRYIKLGEKPHEGV